MQHQVQNKNSLSTGPGSGQYDPRSPFVSVFSHNGTVSTDSSFVPRMYQNVGIPGHRPMFSNNAVPTTPLNNGLDWSAGNRTPYSSPYIVVPSQPAFNGMTQIPPFMPAPVSGQTDQMGQFPYSPSGVYPNVNSIVPPSACPPFPYGMNYDMQDGSHVRANGLTTVDGQRPENVGPMQQYPLSPVPAMGPSSLSGYAYGSVIPQFNTLSLPLQVMKTATGYMIQNLEILTQQEPAIPRAVPAMWTNPSELTLAKCLENREGVTNVYIRGFLPETTDEMLHSYAARFGKIERCKAIVDLDSGLCKGFGFVQFFNFESCENCIRGFFYLGYQASFAQKSRNSRLKDLEDSLSTNIYCTNIPVGWTEADLRRHFEPYRVVSEKISRDEKTGMSKEVGFARFETREIAERVLKEFHNTTVQDSGVKLLLRFADTKAQKMLKQQSNERRAYRAGEYNYSVEVVQGSTPSPSAQHHQQNGTHLTPPDSASNYTSPVLNSNWTPASSISPTYALKKDASKDAGHGSLSSRSLNALEGIPVYRGRSFKTRRSMTDISGSSSKTVMPESPSGEPGLYTSISRKENVKAGSVSPMRSRVEFRVSTPRSCT